MQLTVAAVQETARPFVVVRVDARLLRDSRRRQKAMAQLVPSFPGWPVVLAAVEDGAVEFDGASDAVRYLKFADVEALPWRSIEAPGVEF